MKKGLLTILAAALTIVSCQNYDDQFAELTGLVTTLSTQVAGITEVKNSITTLSQTVTGLKSSLDTSIPGLSTSLDSALADIATLEGLLADVASEGDLDVITEALALVQADVTELLQADAVINQNITINNAATLEYVSSLISSGPDDPSVIVNGRVTIATALLTPAEVASTSLIASKLRTVLGNGAATGGIGVSITGTQVLDLSNLAFVDDDVTISGAKQNIAGLKTITGNFDLNYGKLAEKLDLTNLTTIGGDITIATTTANSATAVDFGTLDASGYVETGAAGSKTNSFPNALTIDTSNAAYVGMDADKATSIVSSMDGVTPTVASMTIGATGGGTIDMNSLVTVGGVFGLTGATTTVAHFDKLKTSGALTVSSAGEAHFGVLKTITTVNAAATAALNFNGVTAIGAAFSATAPLVLVSKLATVTFASTIDMNGLSIPSLTSVTAILTTGVGHINLENAQFSGAGAISTAATKVTIGGTDDGIFANILSSTDIDDLTVTNQKVAVTVITNGVLDKLNVSTKDGGALPFTHTAANGCTELTVSGFDTVSITASDLVTATTAGTIKSLTLNGNTALASLNIGHTFSSKYTNAQLINIVNNDALKSVDLATVVRLEDATITGNAILATILAPATTDLLTVGATLNYLIHTNAVSATYTNAKAAVQDGINDTPYAQAKIANASLASWKDYLVAVSTVNSIVGTYDIAYDSTGTGAGTAYDATTTPKSGTHEDRALLDTENNGSFAADGTTRQAGVSLTWAGSIDNLSELKACE